jgi:CBS domain-containing protein
MRAREIMTRNPACVTADDSVVAAARTMAEHDCGCVPVVRARDDGTVVGVITDRDIAVRGVAHGRGTNSRVGELMTPTPFCCGPDADLHEVEDTMAARQVRRVVIVDDGGRCVGIVAQADVARAAERGVVSDQEVAHVVERISEPSQNWRL